MVYSVSAFSFTEPGLVNQLSGFQTGYTHCEFDCSDLCSVIQSSHEPVILTSCSGESETGLVRTNTDSDEFCIGYIKTNSGSDDSECFHGVSSPQSNEFDSKNTRIRINSTENNRKKLNRVVSQVTDDRKRKRMESNRESAKRSRIRKQRHIENLREEVNQLGLENRELGNRLRTVHYHIIQISTDNNRLLSEQEILRRRFSEMRQILILRQIQNQQQWRRDHQMI